MDSSTKHIVVALRMAGIAGQDKLQGVLEYLAEGHRWELSIYRTTVEFTPEAVRREIEKGADGFIVGLPLVEKSLAELATYDKTIVITNLAPGPLTKSKCRLVRIHSDSQEIGSRAADTLLSQGVFKSFGYVGYQTDDDWSRERGVAFSSELAQSGWACSMFDRDHFGEGVDDRLQLLAWLREQPKPCGIFASCDDRAYEVLQICREEGLKVPQEIALLGVNNDPILCENSEPKLSSVQPDFKMEGYLAAKALETLPRKRNIEVGVKQVVHRESTFPIAPSGKLVQKAISFILKNTQQKLTVADVARHLNVSRSLLDLRFRELRQVPVKQEINKARLDEVKRRLCTTNDPIETISQDCGWDNINSLKNLFRRETGMTMRAWRQAESTP